MPSTTSTPVTTSAAQGLTLIAQLNAVIAAATAEMNAPRATRVNQHEARLVIAECQAAIIDLQQAARQPAPQQITVMATRYGAQSIYLLAQQYLGDQLRYPEIMAASGLKSLALTAGQVLTLPGT